MAVNIFPLCFVVGVVGKSSMLQLPMTPHSSPAIFFVRTAETGRILLMLYRNCTRKGSNVRDRMAVDRLASILLSLGPGICFQCQGGEPGKEPDLANGSGSTGEV